PEQPAPVTSDPVIESDFQYFGTWTLIVGGEKGGTPMGSLTVYRDGTYWFGHMIYGTVSGKWRMAEKNEVVGNKEALVLEDGPDQIDWIMVPKEAGLVSVRYHWGYNFSDKIWFEDSLGILRE